MSIDNVKEVEKHGISARGKKEYLAFLQGKPLTMRQRVLANCYQCNAWYGDGRKDCEMADNCTLHVYMPYRKGGAVKLAKPVSEEVRERMRKMREKKGHKTDSIAA